MRCLYTSFVTLSLPPNTNLTHTQTDQSGEALPQLEDVPEFAHPDALNVGDYIDCLSKAGKWEMVPIEQFSDYRTEFQVVWPDGECMLSVFERCCHPLRSR